MRSRKKVQISTHLGLFWFVREKGRGINKGYNESLYL